MLRTPHGRYMQSWQLLPALGFKSGGHLPPDGFEPRWVQGVEFRCLPAVKGSRKHRIEYHCDCGRWVPYGRAGQHKCPTLGHPEPDDFDRYIAGDRR